MVRGFDFGNQTDARKGGRAVNAARQAPWLSVIIPALNEAARIGATVALVRQRLPGAEESLVTG